jgi:hypothetical protein
MTATVAAARGGWQRQRYRSRALELPARASPTPRPTSTARPEAWRTNLAVAAGHLQSAHVPRVGMNEFSLPSGAFFDGEIDDFRVITGALPCDP